MNGQGKRLEDKIIILLDCCEMLAEWNRPCDNMLCTKIIKYSRWKELVNLRKSREANTRDMGNVNIKYV